MTILGPDGKLVRTTDLQEDQPANLRHLHQEFANHPARGLTPSRLANILRDAEQGDLVRQMELYEDIEERDAHILAEMGKRKRAIMGLDWNIQAPKNATAEEKRITELVTTVFDSLDGFEDLIMALADAVGKGYSCIELTWKIEDGLWMPATMDWRPQSWFMTPIELRNELRLRDNSSMGLPLKPFGWITHIHKAKEGFIARTGLYRALVWPYLFKNFAVRDLAEFLEIYGLPIRLGKYPTGASEKEKMDLLRAVVEVGHNAAGIIPSGMMIEILKAAEGSEKPFEAMIRHCEAAQSKAILGGTLTSQADGKSSTNALGNVHNEVRHDLMVSDAKQIASTLTAQLIWPIVQLNTNGIKFRRSPWFSFDTNETEDLPSFSTALKTILEAGMPVPVSWVRQKTGIPAPEGDEEVLVQLKPSKAPAEPGKSANSAIEVLSQKSTQSTEALQAFVDQMDGRIAESGAVLLKKIKSVLSKAGSLEEMQNALVYLTEGSESLASDLEQAFIASDLLGRFEVIEENGNG